MKNSVLLLNYFNMICVITFYWLVYTDKNSKERFANILKVKQQELRRLVERGWQAGNKYEMSMKVVMLEILDYIGLLYLFE